MDVHGSQKLCMEQERWAEEVREEVRAEFSAMTLTKLMKRAEAAGVSKKALEGAEAEADHKEAVIQLILDEEAGGSDEADLADAALWAGDAALSLGKEGLRMKSDDAAGAAQVVADDVLEPAEFAQMFEAAHTQKFMVSTPLGTRILDPYPGPQRLHVDLWNFPKYRSLRRRTQGLICLTSRTQACADADDSRRLCLEEAEAAAEAVRVDACAIMPGHILVHCARHGRYGLRCGDA